MKNIEKTADLLPKTSKMLQIRLSHATMIHYAWQNRGAVPTDVRYNGMTGKDVCGGGKMTSGDKGLWTEEHPPA